MKMHLWPSSPHNCHYYMRHRQHIYPWLTRNPQTPLKIKKIWKDCMSADGTQSHSCSTLVGAGPCCTMIGQSVLEGQDLVKGQSTKPAYFLELREETRVTGENPARYWKNISNATQKSLSLQVDANPEPSCCEALKYICKDMVKYNLKSRTSPCTTYSIYLLFELIVVPLQELPDPSENRQLLRRSENLYLSSDISTW